MTREELEHLIRAAAAITLQEDLVVLGTAAVLGQFPNAPAALRAATHADLFPRDRPELSALIGGTLGESSPFHQAYRYFARGIDPQRQTLPERWEQRLIGIRSEATRGATGWALEIHDLLVTQYVSGDPPDRELAREAFRTLADADTVLDRLARTQVEETRKAEIAEKIRADARP